MDAGAPFLLVMQILDVDCLPHRPLSLNLLPLLELELWMNSDTEIGIAVPSL